jgi:hypothetical protein
MKKFKIVFLCSNIAALLLEIFAEGAVCNFATPEKTITETFSYFSLTPYGYANFGPFITAILSCVLFIFAVILFTPKAKKIFKATAVISGISLFTSVLPLIMFGGRGFNLISYLISLLMLFQLIAIIILKSKKEVIQNEVQ